MIPLRRHEGQQSLFSGRAFFLIWLPIALVSVGHYFTLPSHHWLHDIFRRLYYIPIIMGAFAYGIRGSVAASIVSSIVYFPHAFTHLAVMDPGRNLEKILEIGLYNVIALITGFLADREYRERLRQQETAMKLQDAIDEMKVMEQQLIRSGKLQALGEMTAGLAHEIKNPLASLKGAAEIISDEIADNSPRKPMVAILLKELDRMGNILNRFLSFARPQPTDMRLLESASLISETIQLISAEARSAGVRIDYTPSEESYRIMGDHDQLLQIFLNICLNAVQAMEEGGKLTLLIEATQLRKREYATFTFMDTGPGIEAQNREKVFNPFFSTKEQGTGLGLSIAARIVESHQGHIILDNRTDGKEGTVVNVLLPLVER